MALVLGLPILGACGVAHNLVASGLWGTETERTGLA